MREKRRDIQGLRALAVVLVVVFHLWPGRLTGGFVGVDIFFVISGFLITAHLFREIEQTGSVSLAGFWARRIRRLLPAGFVVLAASAVASAIWIPRSLLEQTMVEIGAAATYSLNWVLAANSVDYLAADNDASIVQHYWSLAVEEQFYLIWPLLIIAAAALAVRASRRRTAVPSTRVVVIVALGAVFALSFVYSVFATSESPQSAFFVTTTRAWEFAVGGLLVFTPALRSTLRPTVVAGAGIALGWVGVVLIGIAALFFAESTPFPGYAALLPVAGAALVIYSGQSKSAWSSDVVFSLPPVQFLGSISYSVYLWHWPLIVLYPYVFDRGLSFGGRIAILTLTLALAVATKYLVEDRSRSPEGWLRRPRASFGFMASGMVLVLALTGAIYSHTQSEQEQAASIRASAELAAAACLGARAMENPVACADPFAYSEITDPVYATTDAFWKYGVTAPTYTGEETEVCAPVEGTVVRNCEFGELGHPTKVIALVGDSHSQHLVDPLAAYAKKHGWKILLYAKTGCTGFETESLPPQSDILNIYRESVDECRIWSPEVREQLLDVDTDLVLFSNRTVAHGFDPAVVVDFWTQLQAAGKTVANIRDTPEMSGDETAPTCVELSARAYDPCTSPPPDPDNFMSQAITEMAGTVGVVDLTPYICDPSTCHVLIGGVIVYFDKEHFTYTFAMTLQPYLGAQIEALLE